ncbi:MAG: McrC family protein [Actinomycetota bacterium]
MTRITLVEGGEPVEVVLDARTGAALAGSGVVAAEPSPLVPDIWRLRPTTYIGVAEVAGVELWITPKVEIARLLFLIGYALNPRGWRGEEVALRRETELLPAMAVAFERQADRALQQGLLQGYRRTEESLSVLRGRIREADQLRYRFGLAVPLEVVYDDFTVDIPENRLLLSAALRLLRLPRIPEMVRHRLLRAVTRMVDVDEIPKGHQLPSWQPTRLNTRYHTAVRLAELVLKAGSVEQATGEVQVSGFLFDMARIFEDFVTVALSEAVRGSIRPVTQDTGWTLDVERRAKIRPDLMLYGEGGSVVGVVDAKYKAERPSGFPDADLYQMLAYCTALGLRQGRLIYAKGNEEPARYTVRNAGTEILAHALDLQASPDDILDQLSGIAQEVTNRSVEVRSAAGSG